jgi:hypothetical protein
MIKTLHSALVLLSFFISFSGFLVAQEAQDILDHYSDYTEAPREVVYLHLNKSTYVIGETIGFTAYVVNKNDKKPSSLTTNLYVTIEDNTQNTIKKKLIMVNNGIASNTFEVDSLFSQGNYQIKAYTNWMRNFNEQNYFTETIKIKDLNFEESSNNDVLSHKIDAQFLPESGHLLHGVENIIGAVIKDQNGYGIPFAQGEVFDKTGTLLTTFKTNKMGIGRFPLIADINNSYKINISNTDKDYSFNLDQKIERNGVLLSVKRLKHKYYVSAITNANTLSLIKNKRYSLVLHNGNTADLMDIYFTDDTKVTTILELEGSPGVNIITLFNENDQPIAERLVFNYQGITTLNIDSNPSAIKTKDSLSINLNLKVIDTSQFHNISVSVLPKETKSYQRHHSILSYTYLQPYIKGIIENAKYYFTDITEKKKYELDDLLLTQGWSSYDWNTIFNANQNLTYDFEQGIVIKANYAATNLNDKGRPNDLMYYFNNERFLTSEPNIDQKSYIIKRLFPEDDMSIKLSEVTETGGPKPSNLYLQFFPRQIPALKTNTPYSLEIKEPRTSTKEIELNSNFVFQSSKKVEELDEVVIKSNPYLEKRNRRNELSTGRFGKISVVDEDDENTYVTLWQYLSFKAWNILDPKVFGPNGIRNNQRLDTLGANSPSSVNFYLDDILLADIAILDPIFLSEIDYIEINRFGVSEGMKSPKGAIRIFTKDPSRRRSSKKTATAYKFPLAFSKQKKFYVPKYRYYNDDFYKHYGTIDWKPNLVIEANGNITVKIANPEIPITLFIEGITNNGAFIFEEKTISLN